MAQSSCVSRLPVIGEEQPKLLAWGDWRGGCVGPTAQFPVGIDSNLLYSNQYGIGANDIDSMWVPPNVQVTLETNGDPSNGWGNTRIDFDGTHYAGGGINYPGLYQLEQGAADSYGGGGRLGINDADVVRTRPTMPWSQHLYNCCTNPSPDARLCGAYKPGASVCQSRLRQCDGTKLKTDAGCQNMCRSDPTTCDGIKKTFCNANPTDPFCSCMNVEQNPDFIKLQNKIIEKTGQLPRLTCSPFGRCMTGTDLLDVYLPKKVIDDSLRECPSYQTYIDQSLTTSGNNNVITSSQAATANNGGAPAAATTPTTPVETSIIAGISDNMLMVVVGFIVLVAAVFAFISSDTADRPQYGMQPNPQQYGMQPNPQQYGMQPPQQYGMQPNPQQYGMQPNPQQYGMQPNPQQ